MRNEHTRYYTPEMTAISNLSLTYQLSRRLWNWYDKGGISVGRSNRSILLEEFMRTLEEITRASTISDPEEFDLFSTNEDFFNEAVSRLGYQDTGTMRREVLKYIQTVDTVPIDTYEAGPILKQYNDMIASHTEPKEKAAYLLELLDREYRIGVRIVQHRESQQQSDIDYAFLYQYPLFFTIRSTFLRYIKEKK